MKKAKKAVIAGAGCLGAAAGAVAGAGVFLADMMTARNSGFAQKYFEATMPADRSGVEEAAENSRIWAYQHGAREYYMTGYDGTRLFSILVPAEKKSNVYAFCVHGYRSSKFRDFGEQQKYFHDLGYNVIMVDQRATGLSGGDRIGFGYLESRDCLGWLRFYNDMLGSDIELFVCGISMGSATVMMMSSDESLPSNVRFIVADCGYTDAFTQTEFMVSKIKLPQRPLAMLADAFVRLRAGYSLKDAAPVDCVAKARVPILFVHGDSDVFVPTKMVYSLYDACSSEKDLLIVEGAAHARAFRFNPPKYDEGFKKFAAGRLSV